MDEDQLIDLKQFIAATDERLDDLEKRVSKLEQQTA